MTKDTFFANFGYLADAPNGVKKLRELILQLAMQGKLVLQDPKDESAPILLAKIKAEKERLVKEKKIKEVDPLPPVTADEAPYELPQGWEWVRFEDICSYIQRGKGPDYVELSKYPVISQKCVQWNGLQIDKVRFINPNSLGKYSEERFLQSGDLLWNSTGTGTIGRMCLYSQKENSFQVVVADSHVTVLRPLLTNSKFLLFWVTNPTVQSEIEVISSGSTNQIELATSTVKAHPVPLPPLTEQHRIVAKVDQLMTLCDELETHQQKKKQKLVNLNNAALDRLLTARETDDFANAWRLIRDNFNFLYTAPETITKLRQSILQLAVQGKLIPQDPKDEPASVLLAKIKAEKERLIKEKKTKKATPLPPVSPDDIPYELPQGWVWVRLGMLGITQTGTTPSTSNPEFFGSDYPFIKPADISDKGVRYNSGEGLSKEGIEKGRLIEAFSVLMVCIGGSISKVNYIDRDCSCNQQINTITPFKGVDYRALTYFMASPFFKDQVIENAPSTTLPILSKGKWEALPIPLPPEVEQHLIVTKVDQLMKLCDELEAKLIKSQTKSEKLVEAAVRAIASG